jgi:eukaryotic-like serine/threonine-protein kinase
VSGTNRSRPADRPLAGAEPTDPPPVRNLLTPPDLASGSGEPTQALPVSLTTLADERYRLGRQLGAGGMGIVRASRDEVLQREVAVKLLADNLATDPEARERFLREARAAARIHDPHVVAVHDVGDEAGRPYLVMELVDGPSLADVLATEGAFDPDEVVEVAAQALAGLARAHQAGLLHRDVKPGNLLRDSDGTVKVTDFGVAEAADSPGLTRSGFVIGTRAYLAPERRRGQPADVRTDLYALGATLLELLTGRPPDDDASELPDDLPLGLRRLVEALLADDAAARPGSAEEALDVLAGSGRTTAEEAAEAIDDDAVVTAESVAAGRTRVLPVQADAPADDGTVAGGVGTGSVGDGSHGADADVTARSDGARGSAGDAEDRPGPVLPWRLVVVVGMALLAVALVVRLATGGGGTTDAATPRDTEVEDAQTDGTDAEAEQPALEPVERAGDHETTARNLADWLRERAPEN